MRRFDDWVCWFRHVNRQFDANVFSESCDKRPHLNRLDRARLSQLLRRRIPPRTALSTLLTIERDGFRM